MSCILSLLYSFTFPDSFVRVQLGPNFLNLFSLLLRGLAILPSPLESQAAQTHVDFIFCICAIARDLPQETARVAFIESCYNLRTACVALAMPARYRCARMRMWGTRTLLHFFGVQMGMHDGQPIDFGR